MRILILNAPSSGEYINRDQMGGMGQKINFGKSRLTRFLRKMKTSFIRQPVLQLVYAATILSKKHKVKVIDALNENLNLDKVLEKTRKFKPDYVIMAVSASEIEFERLVARKIKELGSKIITVGDVITNQPELFTSEFDIAVTGEIEGIIEEVIEGKKPTGIMYWEKGKVKINKGKHFLTGEELDKLPFPKWELFPYKKYRYYPLLYREPAVSMLSSRGCPFACYYCSYSKNEGKLLRLRSSANVVDEIENNIEKYKIKTNVFRDPLFTGNKARTEKICKLIKDKGLDIVWSCETRPEVLDENLLKIMHKAGCRAVLMGIESIHEKELKAVGRSKIDLGKLRKIFSICNKLGIRTNGFFILGLPESSKESMMQTIDFSLNSGLNHAEYKIATPYPGTKLREVALKKGWIKGDEQELGGYKGVMNINSDFNQDYLNNLCDKAFKSFYYRRKWLIQEFRMGNNLKKAGFMINTIFRRIKE